MPASDYRFVTRWTVPGTREQIYDILENIPRVARFWPSLYRTFHIIKPGDAHGVGKIVEAETRGILPYSLRWKFRVVDARRPEGYRIEAFGDLKGAGEWTFQQNGPNVDVTYVWEISGEKPLLKYFSFLLKPLFAFNHNWVMERGREGLMGELQQQ